MSAVVGSEAVAPLVEIAGVHAGYDNIAVVRDLDLVVNPGEVVALLGPNGAGKTTTLLTISGLLKAIHGSVYVMGRDIDGVAPYKVAQLGLAHVAEDRSLVHRSFDGRSWSEPTSLGGRLASPPAATAWGVDELEVFAIFDDGQLWDRYWDGTSWHDWESLGGELTGTPAASSWGDDRIDVFAPGRDGRVWHRWWDGLRWVDWERL